MLQICLVYYVKVRSGLVTYVLIVSSFVLHLVPLLDVGLFFRGVYHCILLILSLNLLVFFYIGPP